MPPAYAIPVDTQRSKEELVAVLLKRHAKAIIVGENTVGKYVGSNLYPLDPLWPCFKACHF